MARTKSASQYTVTVSFIEDQEICEDALFQAVQIIVNASQPDTEK